MSGARVCLVSPGHVASNPRLVKEADALYAAGFRVRVVAGDYMAEVRPLDETILAAAPWPCVRVRLDSPARYFFNTTLQRAARLAVKRLRRPSVAVWAHSKISHLLAAAAAAEPADLYLAHNLPALPAAAMASLRHRAKLGFDAEDYHVGELDPTPAHAAELAARDLIERAYLPRCEHLTAASPKIAEAYAERYRVSPVPVLNVFPRAYAPADACRSDGDRVGNEPSLYWFSQTIGPGRGLEGIVRAMGRMRKPVRLHLRGLVSPQYRAALEALAAETGVGGRIHFLPPGPPAEMARLAAHHDIGLALELNQPFNRSICLTNKAFVYLLAGLPMLLSDTPAQRQLADELGAVASLVDLSDTGKVAATLDAMLADPQRAQLTRQQSWRLGQERYNWDVEQRAFLRSVEAVLN